MDSKSDSQWWIKCVWVWLCSFETYTRNLGTYQQYLEVSCWKNGFRLNDVSFMLGLRLIRF